MKINTEKIFVIHYTPLRERKEHMEKQLQAVDNDCSYVEEFDKEDLNEAVLEKYYNNDEKSHDEKVAPLWDASVHSYRYLTGPELSSTIKHFEAMKKISEECDNHGLILEDDALLEKDFPERFNFCLDKTPEDWDVVMLGGGMGDWFVRHKISTAEASYLGSDMGVFKMPHPATNCGEAYLMKSNVAKKVYEASVPFDLVSDWELAYQYYKLDLNVYWWVPPLVRQGSRDGTYVSALDEGQRR